jgi:phosphate-selective porin OprO and OprP
MIENRWRYGLLVAMLVCSSSLFSSFYCLAQDFPSGETSAQGGTLAGIQQRLAAIESRLQQLENRVSAIQKDESQEIKPKVGSVGSQSSAPAVAADNPEVTSLEERFEALDQKLRIVERRRELEQEAVAEKAKTTPIVVAGSDGFSASSSDKSFQLKISGYFQAESRFFIGKPSPTTESFQISRARPIIQGTIYKYFDYRIMPDFGGGQPSLQDLHLDFTYLPALKLRFGKFKSPVGLELLASDADLTFVARAFPTLLVPNRDLGVYAFGDPVGGAVSYAFGVTNGVPDGSSGDQDSNDGKDAVARIFTQPFKKSMHESLRGLGIGLSGSYGRQQGTLPSFKTSGQAVYFSYNSTAAADGNRYRLSPQAYYYCGPIGMMMEYVRSSQNVRKGGSPGTIENSAWQVAASYVFGGKPSYRGVSPTKFFNPREGSMGALELAGRYSELRVDGEAFSGGFADSTKSARRARALAAGVTWHMARMVKFVLDYEQTRFKGGGLLGDRSTEHAILSRFQVGF